MGSIRDGQDVLRELPFREHLALVYFLPSVLRQSYGNTRQHFV